MIASKLKKGDGVRVVAPARSLAMPWISAEQKALAESRFRELGLELSFGKHVNEMDEFMSSSIESRVEDLHEAFADPSIKLVITVIGGFNSNQLLPYLDYELIRKNPKLFCGYSDITVLSNALYAKTGLVTYSGPHFVSFGDPNPKSFDYVLEYFKKCFFSDEPYDVLASKEWSNDGWAADQSKRLFQANEGYWVINEGEAEGVCLGGNQCSLNLLQGTEYMPSLEGSILFLEDDEEAHVATIDRDLQSIIHQPDFKGVRGIVFGRCREQTGMTRELLTKIVKTKKELAGLPVIGNVDFGHTSPLITFPIGARVGVISKIDSNSIKLNL